ncbi:MAG: rhomboid family intramembrane serine protease [Acidobacteriota bacterium]
MLTDAQTPTLEAPPSQVTILKPWSWDRVPFTSILVTINVIVWALANLNQSATGSPDPLRFGANFGPSTLSGQWWRLLTSQFLHITLGHLIGNMLLLALLGKRLQKLLGPWTYLLFYLATGTVASLVGLAAFPIQIQFGASGATYGLTGAIAVLYGARFNSLTLATRCKYVLILVIAAVGFFPDFGPFLDVNMLSNYPAHIGGMAAGMALAFALHVRPHGKRLSRLGVALTTLAALIAGAAVLRNLDAYVIPFGRAFYADQAKHLREAETQINLALALRPNNLQVVQQAAAIYIDAHQVNEAQPFVARAMALNPTDNYTLFLQAYLDRRTGRCDAANAVMNRMLGLHGRTDLLRKLLEDAPCDNWPEAPPLTQ